jgi:hypothetical protein
VLKVPVHIENGFGILAFHFQRAIVVRYIDGFRQPPAERVVPIVEEHPQFAGRPVRRRQHTEGVRHLVGGERYEAQPPAAAFYIGAQPVDVSFASLFRRRHHRVPRGEIFGQL